MRSRLPGATTPLIAAVAAVALTAAACAQNVGRLRDDRDAFAAVPEVTLVPGDDGAQLLTGAGPLALADLVQAVLERNPTIERARQGWRAALAKQPQVTSLDDPMLSYAIAPLTIGSDVDFGHTIQLSQALPYPGKRRLRGEIALAEAEAANEDYRALRQRLALMASMLYYDYYVAERALEINQQHLDLLAADRDTIAIRMEAGRAWSEDATQLDVDLVDRQQRQLELEADRDVIVQQLNALLHRRADLPLPAPPASLDVPTPLQTSAAELRERALHERPELRAADRRTAGAESGVALAERNFYPDFNLSATYTTLMPIDEVHFLVGVGINLPIQRSRRHAAVDEAEAKLARSRAETEELRDSIRVEVEKALRHVGEADSILASYRDQLLPTAEALVEANRQGLDTGRTNFVEVVRAERALETIQLRYHMAVAAAYRRRAELERASGQIPGMPRDGGSR